MKKLALLALASAALIIGGSNISNANKAVEERDATVIVKMRSNVDKYSQAALHVQQNNLLKEISSEITSNYRVTSRYSNIFNGFVLEIPSAYVNKIRNLSSVDKVNYQEIIYKEASYNDGFTYVDYNSTAQSIPGRTASATTMEKPYGTADGSGTFVAILDNAFYIGYEKDGTEFHHNVFAPLADKDVYVTQESIKELVDASDSFHGRYDETHSTYFSNKVPFFYDYGGDKAGVTSPDFDVYAEGFEHGTHVASIAAGNAGDEYEGIAPKAQLALMKVFRTYLNGTQYVSGAPNDAIFNALEDCLVLGVDAINMSLGSNLNDFDDDSIYEDTFRELYKRGVFVNVAAGNSGKGMWNNYGYEKWGTDMVETGILSEHANNLANMTVASNTADFQFYGAALSVDGTIVQFKDQVVSYTDADGEEVKYDPDRELLDITKDGQLLFDFVYVPNLGDKADYEGLDVEGKIAVIDRGELSFKDKSINAAEAGAVACIIVDSEENSSKTDFYLRMLFQNDDESTFTPSIPVAFVLYKSRDIFVNSTSSQIEFYINKDLENPDKRIISDYSSDGPRYDLSIKPEISAPGENIKGAVLGEVDKYESLSGTSMATPNMTGAVALMISEHLNDNEYRKTINSRLMSTAQPMKDKVGTHSEYTSVRRQGAGLINLDAALNSNIYLDGVDAEGNALNKAKIELFNNDKVKEGKLDLNFLAINESEQAVTYKATTYVLAPEVEEYDAESSPELAGTKFQVIYDRLVETFEDEIIINPGSNTINIAHDVNDEKLEELASDFEHGCVLEGYVILTATDKYQLSIPFLGFYGDLEAMPAVEEFDFAREDNSLKTSDLLNYFIDKNLITDYKSNYNSAVASGYWKDTTSISLSSVTTNKIDLFSLKDGNGNVVNHAGFSPYDLSSSGTIYAANNSTVNTLIIQQFVNRSIKDNVVNIRSKSSGDVVLTTNMSDALMGSNYDQETGVRSYPLWKSLFNDSTSFIENGYLADRAICIISLADLKDGEYSIEFNYDLMAGSKYARSYDLVVDSESPTLQSVEKVTSQGVECYRLHYSSSSVSCVKIDTNAWKAVKDENGCYVDIPVSSAQAAVILNSKSVSYAEEKFLMHLDDENLIQVSNTMILNSKGYNFSATFEKVADNDQTVSFEFVNAKGKPVTISGNILYRMLVPAGLDIDTLEIFTVAASGAQKALKYTKVGNFIQFETSSKKIRFASKASGGEGGDTPAPTPSTPSKGCGGSITVTSVGVSALALSLAALLMVAKGKKKEDK